MDTRLKLYEVAIGPALNLISHESGYARLYLTHTVRLQPSDKGRVGLRLGLGKSLLPVGVAKDKGFLLDQ